MKVEREKALEHKTRMSRMMEDKENFLSKITAARSFIYKVRSATLICEEECSVEKLTVTLCEHEYLTWRSINGILSFFVCFLCTGGLRIAVLFLKEKLKAFEERLVEERKKRLEERRKQRKEERRNAYYRQKEEEEQRIREEQLKKGN